MEPKRVKKDGQWVETTNIGEPQTFQGVFKEAALAMNLSWNSAEAQDEEGNDITVYLWVNGDWNIHYKGKEYIIPLDDNLTALIDLINSREQS